MKQNLTCELFLLFFLEGISKESPARHSGKVPEATQRHRFLTPLMLVDKRVKQRWSTRLSPLEL